MTLHIDHGDMLPQHWSWEERRRVFQPRDHMVDMGFIASILVHPELGLWRPKDKTHGPKKPLSQALLCSFVLLSR